MLLKFTLVDWLLRNHAPGARLTPMDVLVPVMLVSGHLTGFTHNTVLGCHWIPCYKTHLTLHLYPTNTSMPTVNKCFEDHVRSSLLPKSVATKNCWEDANSIVCNVVCFGNCVQAIPCIWSTPGLPHRCLTHNFHRVVWASRARSASKQKAILTKPPQDNSSKRAC